MKVQIGTVSEGTLRTGDLLPIFANILQMVKGLDDRLAMEAARIGDYESEEARELLGDIEDAIGNYCPPFVYFGAHPDDGFGFWPDMESLSEALREARNDAVISSLSSDFSETTLEEDGVVVVISDHGNVTVMDMERNELWSVV